MRKTLKILSILNCICCCYCLTMFINPIVLENTDMGGFYVIVFGIILSTLMALLSIFNGLPHNLYAYVIG